MFQSRPASGLRLSLFGIPVRVEFSFFLLIALLVFGGEEIKPVESGLLAMAIFFSLVAHEGGHALTARALGCKDISISLWFGGGLARHSPTSRGRNLLIVLMGPAAGLVMAALILLVNLVRSHYQIAFNEGAFYMLNVLLYINIVWSLFNMIPIHPMDGGQALFYTLSFWMGETPAMLFVSRLSMVLCAIVGYFAFRAGWMFALVLCFFFFMSNMRIHSAINRS